jgi:hypothetical protein
MGNNTSAELAKPVATEKSQKLQRFLDSNYSNSRVPVNPNLQGESSSDVHWTTGTKYISHHGRIDSGASGEVHRV